jgi:drug/metabolite transporter (DMT)-like permease
VVALAAGALAFGESIGWRELVGAATMLAGAAVAMRRPAGVTTAVSITAIDDGR